MIFGFKPTGELKDVVLDTIDCIKNSFDCDSIKEFVVGTVIAVIFVGLTCAWWFYAIGH